jgi:hypothetical protein
MDEVKRLDGFVALIDVLGFRELVGREDELTEVGRYVDVVVELLAQPEKKLQFVLFSDNLLINTYDASVSSLYHLIVACSRLSYELAERGIAVRGAIAAGRFLRSPNTGQGVILAGRPIVEANQYEHEQDWVGIMLAQSSIRGREDKLRDKTTTRAPRPGERQDDWLAENSWAMFLQPAQIPFHGGLEPGSERLDGFAILPMTEGARSAQSVRASITRTRDQYRKMKLSAPNPGAQRKFSFADCFLHGAAQTWGFNCPWPD